MSSAAFKYAASVLTCAVVMTGGTLQAGFLAVPHQEIDCSGNTYQSFADAKKSSKLDEDKAISFEPDPNNSHHLPPGVAIENAPKATQDAITNELLNNGGIRVWQGDTLKGGYKCRLVNS